MKVSSLFFVGFLGAAIATESEAGAEDDWSPEYSDADGEEYAVPSEYCAPPDYGESKSYADDELEPRYNSGWFIPDANDGFYWMSKEEFNIERQAILQLPEEEHPSADIKPGGNADDDLMTYILYYYDGNRTTSEILRWNDTDALSTSKFVVEMPCVFLIYDWSMTCNSDFVTEVRTALFEGMYQYNVFCVGWSYYSTKRYHVAAGYVEVVGKYVARFIDFVNSETSMSFNDLTLVGYGLGAHVAGHAGKNVEKGKIDIIIGLDPAGPGFDFYNFKNRLYSTDANYVQSIQTNGGDSCQRGFNEPLSTQTFYPDGGIFQTPCVGPGEFGCSHSMSYKYYARALEMDIFCASECENYDQAQNRDCGIGYSLVNMGFPKKYNRPGVYYVPIHREEPYGACDQYGMDFP